MVWEIMKCYPHWFWYIGTRARQSKGSSCLQRVCNSICNGVVQMSTSGSSDASALIPVPSFLFQGSIALGSICEAVLGPATDGKHLVHPFLIAGWCGLFTQVPSSFLLHFAHASFAAFNELHIHACVLNYGISLEQWRGLLAVVGGLRGLQGLARRAETRG
jgi:hypothetical protein